MPRNKTKPEVLERLQEITKMGKESLVQKISRKVSSTGLTHNAAAHVIAVENDSTLWGKLDENDKHSWREYQSRLGRQSQTVVIKQVSKGRGNNEKGQKKPLIDYVSYHPNHAHFVNGHIQELTKAYHAECYTAVFILFRKIIENLIIDILRAKFPMRRDLVYFAAQKRYHDFSVVMENLFNERSAFSADGEKAIARLNGIVGPFRKEANDRTHSWFYLVTSPNEVKDADLPAIIETVKVIEKEVGLRP